MPRAACPLQTDADARREDAAHDARGRRQDLRAGWRGSLKAITEPWPFLIDGGFVMMDDADHRQALQAQVERWLETSKNPQEATVLSLWVLTLEECEFVSEPLAASLLRVKASEEGGDLCDRLRSARRFFKLVDSVHRLIKTASGKEPVVKENGSIKLNNGNNAGWIAEFETAILGTGPEVGLEFMKYGEAIENVLRVDDDPAELMRIAGVEPSAPGQ